MALRIWHDLVVVRRTVQAASVHIPVASCAAVGEYWCYHVPTQGILSGCGLALDHGNTLVVSGMVHLLRCLGAETACGWRHLLQFGFVGALLDIATDWDMLIASHWESRNGGCTRIALQRWVFLKRDVVVAKELGSASDGEPLSHAYQTPAHRGRRN